MAIKKTEAIVLRTQPFRSSSLIVTFFTRSFGKLRGIAKGVRQGREMRGALYELFTQLEIVFYEKTKSDLHLISEASILDSYPSLRKRLESIGYASYFSELADVLSEVHDPHEKIYELLDFSFRYLPSLPGKRLSRLFEIKLMNEIGWLPFLTACLGCQTSPLESGFFSARQGALLCHSCAKNNSDAQPLSREALSVMRRYIQHSLEESVKFTMSQQTERDLEVIMGRFLSERLHKPLKTKQFLVRVKQLLK